MRDTRAAARGARISLSTLLLKVKQESLPPCHLYARLEKREEGSLLACHLSSVWHLAWHLARRRRLARQEVGWRRLEQQDQEQQQQRSLTP